MDSHRVGGRFGRSETREDVFDFVKPFDDSLRRLLDSDRFVKGDTAVPNEIDDQITLVERRHEIGAEPQIDKRRPCGQSRDDDHDGPAIVQGKFEHGPVGLLKQSKNQRLSVFLPGRAKGQIRQNRHEHERRREGRGQRKEHHLHHRAEEFSFDAFKREDRKIHGHDEDAAKSHGGDNLFHRAKHDLQPFPR